MVKCVVSHGIFRSLTVFWQARKASQNKIMNSSVMHSQGSKTSTNTLLPILARAMLRVAAKLDLPTPMAKQKQQQQQQKLALYYCMEGNK